MNLTMYLGIMDADAAKDQQHRAEADKTLEAINAELRAAGLPEYTEVPAKGQDEEWNFTIHHGFVEQLRGWARQHANKLGVDAGTLQHLTEAEGTSSIYLPTDFPGIIRTPNRPLIGSAPRLQQAVGAVAARLGIADPGHIPYDFSGEGRGIVVALEQAPVADRDTRILQLVSIALYQGASLAISRSRALVFG